MIQLLRARAILLALFISVLSSQLICMVEKLSPVCISPDKENTCVNHGGKVESKDEEALLLHIYETVRNALSLIKEFNFRALKESDQKLQELYMALVYFFNYKAGFSVQAAVYFDNDKATQLIDSWRTTKQRFAENESLRITMTENLCKALPFLVKVMKSKKVVAENRTNLEINAFKLVVDAESYFKDFIETHDCQNMSYRNAKKHLNCISDFNFKALKRNDEKLQVLHEELACFLNRKAKSDRQAAVYFDDVHTMKLIYDWNNQNNSYTKNRATRNELKIHLFNALEFFEKMIVNSLENDLLDQLQATRTHMVERVCARS